MARPSNRRRRSRAREAQRLRDEWQAKVRRWHQRFPDVCGGPACPECSPLRVVRDGERTDSAVEARPIEGLDDLEAVLRLMFGDGL